MVERVTIIGVISDTHGLLRPEAIAALHGVDRILHAGDVGDPEILVALAQVAPVTAVRGNIDTKAWAAGLSQTEMVEVDGVTIYMLHDLSQLDLKLEAAGIQSVVYGHSHQPKIDQKNGVLFFNPGSAGPRRFNKPTTIGKLTVEAGAVRAEIIDLAGK
jgi:uncharacterized protein